MPSTYRAPAHGGATLTCMTQLPSKFRDDWFDASYLALTRDIPELMEKLAREQSDTVAKVHAEGWRNLTKTIGDGLTAIARAIEGRR